MLSYTSAPPTLENLSTYAIRGRGLSRATPLLVSLVFLILTGCDTVGRVSAIRTVTTFEGGRLMQVEERADAVQPSRPADAASAAVSTSRGPSATTPPTDNPAPATPADWAYGGMVWLGAACILLGVLSLFAKKWPALAWLPSGASYGLIAGGVGLCLLGSLLDSVPWWAWLIVGGAALAVSWFGGAFDNWRRDR